MLLLVPVAPADDWPHWRGPAESGITAEKFPRDPDLENVIWRAKVGIGFSSFAVADGKAYTLGHQGGEETVFCFDAKSGDIVWKSSYRAPLIDRFYEGGPGATPTIRDGRVFVYSKHGQLRCFQAADGQPVWERDMMAEAQLQAVPEWGFACSPYFIDGGKKLVIEAGTTIALEPATGKVIWKGDRHIPAYGTPKAFEFEGRTLLAMLKTEGVVVADADGGKTLATAPWKTSFNTNGTSPIVAKGERSSSRPGTIAAVPCSRSIREPPRSPRSTRRRPCRIT